MFDLRQIISHDIDVAACNRQLPQQQLDQCRFTGSAVSDNKYKLAFVNTKIDVLKRRRSR